MNRIVFILFFFLIANLTVAKAQNNIDFSKNPINELIKKVGKINVDVSESDLVKQGLTNIGQKTLENSDFKDFWAKIKDIYWKVNGAVKNTLGIDIIGIIKFIGGWIVKILEYIISFIKWGLAFL